MFDAIFAKARATPPSASHVDTGAKNPNSANDEHQRHLESVFVDFPDTWEELRNEELVYVRYHVEPTRPAAPPAADASLDDLIASGYVGYKAIIYEDFLCVAFCPPSHFRSWLISFACSS